MWWGGGHVSSIIYKFLDSVSTISIIKIVQNIYISVNLKKSFVFMKCMVIIHRGLNRIALPSFVDINCSSGQFNAATVFNYLTLPYH